MQPTYPSEVCHYVLQAAFGKLKHTTLSKCDYTSIEAVFDTAVRVQSTISTGSVRNSTDISDRLVALDLGVML